MDGFESRRGHYADCVMQRGDNYTENPRASSLTLAVLSPEDKPILSESFVRQNFNSFSPGASGGACA